MGSPVSLVVAEIVMQSIKEQAQATYGKIPFLDCLVSQHNNKLQTTIYRKLIHTDRLLDQSSNNPTYHKATTIRTLTRRAQLVCDSTNSLPTKANTLTTFSVRTITTQTLLNATFIKTMNPTQLTPNLSPQLQYPTSRALLRLSHRSYNLTTSVSLTNRLRLYDNNQKSEHTTDWTQTGNEKWWC